MVGNWKNPNNLTIFPAQGHDHQYVANAWLIFMKTSKICSSCAFWSNIQQNLMKQEFSLIQRIAPTLWPDWLRGYQARPFWLILDFLKGKQNVVKILITWVYILNEYNFVLYVKQNFSKPERKNPMVSRLWQNNFDTKMFMLELPCLK